MSKLIRQEYIALQKEHEIAVERREHFSRNYAAMNGMSYSQADLYSEITLKYSQAQAHEDALCVKVYRLGEELSVAERAEQNQGIFIKAVILNKDLTEFNTMKDNLLAAEKNFATSQEEVLRLKSELEDAKSALLKEHEAKMKVTKKVIKRITVAEPVEKIEPAAPLQFSHQLNQ